jgi:PilZ domain
MQPKPKDARRTPRAKLRQSVRIRPFDQHCPPEVCTTVNLSRQGIYFETPIGHYFAGMGIAVTRNFAPDDPLSREEVGEVVRVERLQNGKWGIAVRIFPITPS